MFLQFLGFEAFPGSLPFLTACLFRVFGFRGSGRQRAFSFQHFTGSSGSNENMNMHIKIKVNTNTNIKIDMHI